MDAEATVTPIVPIVDPVLTDKVKALHALATTHHILNNGSYKFSLMMNIDSCLAFLENLHKQLLEEALAHVDADKVPQLVEMKKTKVGDENGKAAEESETVTH